MTKPLLLLACLLMLLGSCTGHSSQRTATTDSIVADSADFAHAVHFDYAKGIQVANHPGYKEVFIFTPDEPDTLARYILYPRDHKPAVNAPGARFIAVPVRTMGTLSTTEIGALTLLDLRDVLVACSDPRNINDSILAERTRRGEIAEIGRGMGRNVEQIIATHPEIIMQGLQDSDGKDEDIRASGI
ncbi:MAG: iron ABC transporter substrate-binding protein, partial [Porphyromonas sp.]|nr:iron ABC transporter substrate-binding protein [Porphyromonas sp.]